MTRKFTYLAIFCSIPLLLTGIRSAMSDNDTKFDWYATDSAPEHYPMEIIRGTFIYHGEAEEGLYIPSGGTLSSGWGRGISQHVVGEKYKPLPDRLKIIFFSYAEKQFYKGDFKLPYEKILALFREGVENGKPRPSYTSIMAGIAPGGTVAVWLSGKVHTEVFFGNAEKIDLDPSRAFDLPFESKKQADEYIAKQLTNTLKPEELESLKNNGIPFGLWGKYRNRYDWRPVAKDGFEIIGFDAIFLNGENDNSIDSSGVNKKTNNFPVPSRVSFDTHIDNKKKIFIIHFDEQETMSAFETLGSKGQKLRLEFEPRLPKTQIRIWLSNDDKTIELKKFVSEDW